MHLGLDVQSVAQYFQISQTKTKINIIPKKITSSEYENIYGTRD